ncbi:hypothetical protein G5I_10062 [Acromyrmex echinatior]|uniref:Uncharacterized protein n=1 Tax=Acromyrmex echinatior TaxID=103372 RepID=F4WVV9_ACREC|nr:hypothetical protein G5I_10062 [Acromyrmex echinatior]
MIAAGVCNNTGLGKDSLPGVARAILQELIYTLLFRSLVFKRQSLAPRISSVMLPETICQIRCVIVVINDPYYHSEALTRRGVKETIGLQLTAGSQQTCDQLATNVEPV